MPILVVVGPAGSGTSTLAHEFSQNRPLKAGFDAIVDAQSTDQALEIASKNMSTIVLAVHAKKFLNDEYKARCAEIARRLTDSNLRFIVVGTAADELSKEEADQAMHSLHSYFPQEPAYLYSSRPPSNEKIFAPQAVTMGVEPSATYGPRVQVEKVALKTMKDALQGELQKKENINEPQIDVELPGVKLKAIGPVAYPFILAVSFLLVFYGVSQLASNIKGTDWQAGLNAVITSLGLIVGVWLLVKIVSVTKVILPKTQT